MYKDVNEAQVGIATFTTNLGKLLKSQTDAKKEGHERSWSIVAEGYVVAHALAKSPQVRAELLTKASIVEKDGNPFSPVVRLLYRKDGKFNTSAKKYGPAMRYAWDHEWAPEDFVKRVAALEGVLKDGRKVTKLLAAELLDREKHGGGEDPARVAAAFDLLGETQDFGRVSGSDVPVEGREDGSWVSLGAQWDAASGSYVLRAVIGTNSAGVQAQVKKEALRLLDLQTTELMRDLTVANADVATLNRMEPALRRDYAKRVLAKGTFDWDELNARFIEPSSEPIASQAA